MPWHQPIRIESRDTCGVDPYSVLLEVDGQTYDADNRGFDFAPDTGLITFMPAKASPRPLLFADGQKVRVRLLKATDHLGRPYVVEGEGGKAKGEKPRTLETEYSVSSPLKLSPANPDGKNGWYVTMPMFSVDATPP